MTSPDPERLVVIPMFRKQLEILIANYSR